VSDKSEWQTKTLAKTLERGGLRKESFSRSGGEPIDDVYGPEDAPDAPVFPGEFPYTRGIHSTMYRSRFWTMRQYAGFGTAAESNARYRMLLEKGQTGLSVAFDLPTQMGYDSDHSMSIGEVGKVGVAIDTLSDMRVLFDRIPLGEVSTSMTINATASTLLAFYVAVAEEQGVGAANLRGTIQNDILKEYIARGTYIYPPRPSMRVITDIFSWCSENAPKWNTISISGYHIREAGSTAAQEIAFTLADGISYVEAALTAGLEVDVFAPRLSFFFNAHNNFLEEIAKFRAARRMWAKIMRTRFKAKSTRSMQLRFHTQVAGSTLAASQIDNNVVRVALQALAAVMGGTQSLHTNGRDEALALPTEASATLALRTQQIIAHESGVADFVDPFGGSYTIERLTDELEEEANRIIAEVDALGGMVSAIEEGFPQREIQSAAYRHQREFEAKEKVVVGVNAFTQGAESKQGDILRLDPALEDQQVARLREVRSNRDERLAQDCQDALRQAASGTDNLMPPILAAVKADSSLGEISASLESVFGKYTEKVVL
jgi:methylmalonyl-CoA mutase N-terminal domain/subunit